MLYKKSILVVMIVSILISSGLAVLTYQSNNINQNGTNEGNVITNHSSEGLPSYVTSVSSLQSSIYSSLIAYTEGGSSSGINSLLPGTGPGTASMSPVVSSPVPQTGYVQNTLDTNSNKIYQGSNSGQNYVGQSAVVYDPTNGDLYVSAYAYGSVGVSADNTGQISSIIILNASTMNIIGNVTGLGVVIGMEYDPFNGYIYVANESSPGLVVLNTADNSIVADLPLSSSVYYMAVNPTTGYIYATLSSSEIAVISSTSIVTTVSTSTWGTPYGIAYDSADNSLYISFPGYSSGSTSSTLQTSTAGAVVEMSLSSYAMTKVQNGYSITKLAYSSGNVFGTQLLGKNITEISGGSVVKNIPLKYGMFSIFANPYNTNLYISYQGSQNLWNELMSSVTSGNTIYMNSSPADIASGGLMVYNTTSGTITHNSASLISPVWIAFDASTGTSYASYPLPGKVVSMTTSYKTATKSLLSTPSDSYFDSSNGYLYVTDTFGGNVKVYNAAAETLVKTINTGGLPLRISHNSQGTDVYVTNMANDSVDVISGLNIVKQYSVGYMNLSYNNTDSFSLSAQIPAGIAYDSTDNSLYIALSGFSFSTANLIGNGTIAILSLTSGTTKYLPATSPIVLGVAYDQSNNLVYVADYYFSSSANNYPVQVISGTSIDKTAMNSINSKLSNSNTGMYYSAVDLAYDANSSSVYLVMGNLSYSGVSQFDYAEISGTSTVSQIETLTLSSYPYSYTWSAGVNYNPYTGNMMISTFMLSSTTGSGYLPTYMTGGVVFLNGLTIIGYAPAGRGTSSAQAISSHEIYTTNSVQGTISLITNSLNGTGNLTIKVNPASANVLFNGGSLALQNGKVTVTVGAGYYYIYASEPGYSSYTNYIKIVPGQNVTLDITLSKITTYGYLVGTITPGNAILSANGISIPVSSDSFSQTLLPGTYFISANAKGYESFQGVVNVTKDQTSYLNISLTKTAVTYEVSGYLNPYNSSLDPAVLFNGVVSYVNATGYFQAYLASGTYHMSASENGYFSVSRNVTVNADESIVISLIKEPKATSSLSNNSTSIRAYNATIQNVAANYTQGFIGVTFNATANSTLVISVPFTMLSSHYRNLTVSDLINSKVYIGATQYRNFSVTLSSDYTVTLTVYNYSGDPSLYWVYTPYSTFTQSPAPPNTPANSPISPYLLYAAIGVVAILIIGGVVVVSTRRRKR